MPLNPQAKLVENILDLKAQCGGALRGFVV